MRVIKRQPSEQRDHNSHLQVQVKGISQGYAIHGAGTEELRRAFWTSCARRSLVSTQTPLLYRQRMPVRSAAPAAERCRISDHLINVGNQWGLSWICGAET